MAWSTPLTAVSNTSLTAAQWNASVRDNLLETAPAKATLADRIFVTTGANQLAQREVPYAAVGAIQSTANASFTNLATVGPSVTLTTGFSVIVILSCYSFNNTVGANAQMGVAVSGATTIAATSDESVTHESGAAGDLEQMSYVFGLGGLNPGVNTFTCQYLAGGGGTASFGRRRLIIFPFGN